MKRSITMISLVLIATVASGTAAASAERGDDARAKVKHSHVRTPGAMGDSLKSLRLEGTDRFESDYRGKGSKHKALGRSRWHRADFDGWRGASHHPRASGPASANAIPGDYPIPGNQPAPSQPIPEPISAILFASGALVVGYSVRRPLGSSN